MRGLGSWPGLPVNRGQTGGRTSGVAALAAGGHAPAVPRAAEGATRRSAPTLNRGGDGTARGSRSRVTGWVAWTPADLHDYGAGRSLKSGPPPAREFLHDAPGVWVPCRLPEVGRAACPICHGARRVLRTCGGPPTRSRLPAGGLNDGPSGPIAVAASDPSRLMDAPLRYTHTHGRLLRGRAVARNLTRVGHSRLLLQRQPHSTPLEAAPSIGARFGHACDLFD